MIRGLRRLHIPAVVLGAALFAGACFGSPSQRPPRNAEMISAERLSGLWEGTYRARTVDRDGRFRLKIEQRGDSLGGWLELLGVASEQLRAPLATGGNGVADVVHVDIPSVVIDGVRARIHSASYVDPGCGCALTLELTGFMVADTLAGFFDATGTAVTAAERGGRWKTVRVP